MRVFDHSLYSIRGFGTKHVPDLREQTPVRCVGAEKPPGNGQYHE